MTTPDTYFVRLTALADLGRLLAMFMQLPTQKLAEALSHGWVQDDLHSIMAELAVNADEISLLDDIKGKNSSDLWHALRQEYTRLFTHPDNPAIYSCEYLFRYSDSSHMCVEHLPLLHINPAAIDASEAYHRANFQPAASHESADHISSELEFAAYLLCQTAKGEIEGEALTAWQKAAANFYKIHLSRWGSDFFTACSQNAKGAVYQAVGDWGKIFCQEYEVVVG